jgi:parvulin-like peptidyl-prolyl isomerase
MRSRILSMTTAILFASGGGLVAQQAVLLDALMATVNGEQITVGDVMSRIQGVQQQLVMKYRGEDLRRETRKAFDSALQSLIERRLVLDAYKTTGGQIPEWVVDRRVSEIIHDVFDDDRNALVDALAADHMTYDMWRDNMRNQVIMASMRQAHVQDRTTISAAAVRRYYDDHTDTYRVPAKVWVSMILLKQPDDDADADEARAAAQALATRLKTAEDFAAAAVSASIGHKAEAGGDWGWIDPSDLRAELRDTIRPLPKGGVSAPIETIAGTYLVRVNGRREDTITPFEDVREGIEKQLQEKELDRVYDAWIVSLKKDAWIDVKDLDPFAR